MGFHVSWIALAGSSSRELLSLSGRNLSGERQDFPEVGWYLLELSREPSPWVLLIAAGSEYFMNLRAPEARSLSRDGNEAFYFRCCDTVMATEIVHFKDGVETWSIEYDCADKTKGPAMKGAVPLVAHEILKKLQAEQEADDGADCLYDITADLGQSLVGFRHDIELELEDPQPFQVLGEPTKSQSAWWQFWK